MAGVRKASGPSATLGVAYDLQKAQVCFSTVDGATESDITGIADELPHPLRVVEQSEEVRTERIRVLREQIANGTYNLDPHEVARKLLEHGFR